MLVGLVPAGVVTLTSTVPVPFTFGETAVIDAAEFMVKLLALVAPKWTAVAPVKPVPVMVTAVPPPGEPRFGSTLVDAGSLRRPGWPAFRHADRVAHHMQSVRAPPRALSGSK